MRFTKMHGIGNDYIFIDGFEEKLKSESLPALSREMSDRHFGVGADGLIVILPSKRADFRMRMFNADGSEGEMCGNGIRCFGRYVYEKGLTKKTKISVETLAGMIVPELVLERGKVKSVRVDMGVPRFRRSEVPMLGREIDRVVDERITAAEKTFFATCLSMGNPHCVVFIDDMEEVILDEWGPAIETHPIFPNRTNVEFVQRIEQDELFVKVWERGSGATLACGTGACAVVVAAAMKGLTGRSATVRLPGGSLGVDWSEDDGHVYLTGPCEETFEGVYTRKRPAK